MNVTTVKLVGYKQVSYQQGDHETRIRKETVVKNSMLGVAMH